MDANTIICSKLALSRCKHYAEQIQAVIFLCRDEQNRLNESAADNVQRIVSLLSQDLQASYDMMSLPLEVGN